MRQPPHQHLLRIDRQNNQQSGKKVVLESTRLKYQEQLPSEIKFDTLIPIVTAVFFQPGLSSFRKIVTDMTSKQQATMPADKKSPEPHHQIDHYHSKHWYSMLLLQNLNSLFYLGAVRPLEQSDLGNLPEDSRVPAVHGRFEQAMKNKGEKSIWMVLFETIGWRKPLWGLFLQAICSASAFAPPQILNALVEYFAGPLAFPNGQLSTTNLWVLVVLLLIIPVIGVICGAHSFMVFLKIAASVKAAMLPAIYRKALKLSSGARLINSSGMIMNLFGNDITHIQLFLATFADPVFAPAQLVCALALIYQQIGLSMFVGLLIVVGNPMLSQHPNQTVIVTLTYQQPSYPYPNQSQPILP